MTKIVINEDGSIDARIPDSEQLPSEESVCGRAEIAASADQVIVSEQTEE